jgi:hypothetical protein
LVPTPSILATSNAVTPGGLWFTKTRHDAVVQLAQSIGAEVAFSRTGVLTIADAQVLGAPTGNLVGLAEGFKRSPNWDAVYNVVAASSTMSGVTFDAARVGITWGDHPAAPQNLGSTDFPVWRVYTMSSPLLADYGQALDAATTTLARVSALSETYSFSGIPDPRIDAGDSVIIPTVTGGWKVAQVASVTHPLTPDGKQVITTIAANASSATDLLLPPMFAPGWNPAPVVTTFIMNALFNGAGNLSAVAGVRSAVTAPFTGTGVLSALVGTATSQPVVAPFTGTGSLTAVAVSRTAVTATFTGSGSLTAVATPTYVAAIALFTGSGSLTASVMSVGVVTALFTGTGSLTAVTATGAHTVVSPFSATGTLTATTTQVTPVTALFTGAGSLTAAAVSKTAVTALFTGAGTLTATYGTVTMQSVFSPFTGAGTLTAVVAPKTAVTATFGATAQLTVTMSAVTQVAVTAAFTGSGVFTAVTVTGGGGATTYGTATYGSGHYG